MTHADREAENRRLLEAAGYAWDADAKCWARPRADRILNGEIARTLTREQLLDWIAAGDR